MGRTRDTLRGWEKVPDAIRDGGRDATICFAVRWASDQLAHRLHVGIDEVVRTTGVVLHGSRREVDAEVVVQRREHFLKVYRTVLRGFAETVRGADHLPGPHPAAR